MKLKLNILAFCFPFMTMMAQVNLVSNGDLESYSQCPDFVSQINYANNWNSPSNGTPDYMNMCNPTNPNPIDFNFGSQNPYSGAGLVGILCYANAIGNYNKREYIQGTLTQPLIANNKYIISFQISLADESKYSVSNIDCYFGVGNTSVATDLSIGLSPQIKNDTVNYFNDKINWYYFEKTYLANGGEDHIIIGNFNNDLNTNTNYNGTGFLDGAYYLFDNVSVIDSASIGIKEIDNSDQVSLYPNPTNEVVKIDASKVNENSDLQFVIYNALGLEIKHEIINSNTVSTLDLSELANGTYVYKIFSKGNLYKVDRLVIIK